MRKFFAVIILAATLLSLLSGCGAKSPKSGIKTEEVLTEFELQILEAELAEYYTTARLPEVEDPETGDVYQTLIAEDFQEGETCRLRVRSTAEGYVHTATISIEDEGLASLAFPTFCLYLVNALKLTEVDGLELSEDLGLFEDPSGAVTSSGWELSAVSALDELIFRAKYIGE